MNSVNRMLRPLRGGNLEVFKFGMYLLFPIGWMYYFGTNLENRFAVPDFWPTQEQSHKIPFEREEIKAEVQRIQKQIQQHKEATLLEQLRRRKEQEEDESREKAEQDAAMLATQGHDGLSDKISKERAEAR